MNDSDNYIHTKYKPLAEAKRRERCWLSFARGATPSMAMKSSLRGFAI
jgi:hypothetical protein